MNKYIHFYMCVCIHTQIYKYVNIQRYIYIFMCVCVYMYSICTYIFKYICKYDQLILAYSA